MVRVADHPVAFARKVLGVEVHDGQAAFLGDRHAWRVLIGGRRSGKSMAMAVLIAWTAVVHAVERRPITILIAAPVLDQAKVVLAYALKLLRSSPVGGLVTKHIESPYPEVQLGHDVILKCRSVADHGKHIRGHGANVGLVVLDEAGFVSESIIQEVLAPLLADRAESTMILASTPTRTGSVLHRYFDRGRDGTDSKIRSFHFKSLDNPWLNRAFVESQRQELTDQQWRVEWQGEWSDPASSFFKWDAVMRCAQLEPGSFTGARHVIGYDPAKLVDGSGICVLDHSTMPRRIVRVLDLGGRDYKTQIDQVVQLSKEYGNARVIVDATGGGNVVVDLLRAAGVSVEGVTWTASRKADMLTAFAAAIERQELLFPPDVALLRELRWFEIKRGPTGAAKYEAAAGQKDDLVCAAALALLGCGGIVRQESFASLGLPPFLRSGDRVGQDVHGRPAVTGLEDGFPSWAWS